MSPVDIAPRHPAPDGRTEVGLFGDVRRSMLFLALVCVCWPTVELLGAALSQPYSPFEIVWCRYGVHLAFMLLVWGRHDPLRLLRTDRPVAQLGRSLLMVAMPTGWILALHHGAAPNLLLATLGLVPLLTLVLGALINRESAPPATWPAAVAVLVGTALVTQPAAPDLPAATGALTGAASLALYLAVSRRLRAEDIQVSLFYTALGVFAVLSLEMPRVWIQPSLRDLGLLICIGLVGWVVLFALDRAADVAPPAAPAPILGLIPLISCLVAQTAAHAWPGHRFWAGALLMGGAVSNTWRLGRNPLSCRSNP
jgi:drug/metabolite transporter (DMT)-like permease